MFKKLLIFSTVAVLAAMAVLLDIIIFPKTGNKTIIDPNRTYTVKKDITYCKADGVGLSADVYSPKKQFVSMPLVLYIHGGGWRIGRKEGILGGAEVHTLHALTTHGYVVASINYRLAPKYAFPAQIEDAKCAVRFFRNNALEFHINPHQIAAWGDSAGGHLAGLLGTAGKNAGWDVGEYSDKSSSVEAVIDWFGPNDLSIMPSDNFRNLLAEIEVFHTLDSTKLLKSSPVYFVNSADPPFLLQHGLSDTRVPPVQSQEFFDILKKHGVSVQIQWVENANHEFVPASSDTINPSLDQIGQKVVEFLNTTNYNHVK